MPAYILSVIVSCSLGMISGRVGIHPRSLCEVDEALRFGNECDVASDRAVYESIVVYHCER